MQEPSAPASETPESVQTPEAPQEAPVSEAPSGAEQTREQEQKPTLPVDPSTFTPEQRKELLGHEVFQKDLTARDRTVRNKAQSETRSQYEGRQALVQMRERIDAMSDDEYREWTQKDPRAAAIIDRLNKGAANPAMEQAYERAKAEFWYHGINTFQAFPEMKDLSPEEQQYLRMTEDDDGADVLKRYVEVLTNRLAEKMSDKKAEVKAEAIVKQRLGDSYEETPNHDRQQRGTPAPARKSAWDMTDAEFDVHWDKLRTGQLRKEYTNPPVRIG